MNCNRIVILAGGRSSRMSRSLPGYKGDRITKCMIEIPGSRKPFLEYLLMNIEEAGISEVVIVTASGDTSVKHYFSDSYGSISISYVDQLVPEGRSKPAGTADALLQVLNQRPSWKGSTFMVCNSDNLYSVSILKALSNSASNNTMPCYRKKGLNYPEDRTGSFAVISLTEDLKVHKIIEKPSPAEVTANAINGKVYVSMNLFRLDRDTVLPFLENAPFSPERDEKELSTAVDQMLREDMGLMFGIPVCEHVPDLTSAVDIKRVSEELV